LEAKRKRKDEERQEEYVMLAPRGARGGELREEITEKKT